MKKETKKRSLVVAGMIGLLALVGVTAGKTYAKYVGNAEATASNATVAKWGFTVTVQENNLFGQYYKGGVAVADNTDSSAVVVGGSGNVVAPGTHGSLKVQINGTAEVKAQIKIALTGEFKTVDLVSDAGDHYYPVKWSVKGIDGSDVVEETNPETIKAELNQVFDYKPGDATVEKTIEISWDWAFTGNDDAKDTLLGQLAAGEEVEGYKAVGADGSNLTIGFDSLAISIEQLNA